MTIRIENVRFRGNWITQRNTLSGIKIAGRPCFQVTKAATRKFDVAVRQLPSYMAQT